MTHPRHWIAIVLAVFLLQGNRGVTQDLPTNGSANSGGSTSGGSGSGGSSGETNGASSSFGSGTPSSSGQQPATPSTPSNPSPPSTPSTPNGPSTPSTPSTPGLPTWNPPSGLPGSLSYPNSSNPYTGRQQPGGTENGGPAPGGPQVPPTPNIFGTTPGPAGTAPPGVTGGGLNGGLNTPVREGPGPASAFGTPPGSGAVAPPPSAVPNFTLPTAYGQNPFPAAGVGLHRPRFHYTASLQTGFDDNVLETSYNAVTIPAVTQKVEVSPEIPAQTVTLALPPSSTRVPIFLRPHPQTQTRTITIAGKPAEFQTVLVSPEIAAPKQIQSFVIRVNGTGEVSFASRRTVFSMRLNLGEDIYTDRPGDKTDPSDSFNLNFVHQISPRLRFSASVGGSYVAQPSVQQVNSSPSNVGSYLQDSIELSLDYAWSKRLSTVISGNFLSWLYNSQSASNESDIGAGLENRYLWSPRLTLLADLRVGNKTFPKSPARDSNSYFLLLGAEANLSSHFAVTIRTGESVDIFSESGQAISVPYFESTLSWRFNPAGFVSMNARYGFEDPPDAQSTVKTLRVGASVIQALNKHLRASAGLTYVQTQSTAVGAAAPNQVTGEVNVGAEYDLSRHVTLSASYTTTLVLQSGGVGDYYHNQIFFGLNYTF